MLGGIALEDDDTRHGASGDVTWHRALEWGDGRYSGQNPRIWGMYVIQRC